MWAKIANIAELHRQEADLFGSSDVGQSRFLMRLNIAVTETNTMKDEYWPPASWQRYSGYGLRDKEEGGTKLERCFLKPGRDFTVHLNLRRCSVEQVSQVVAAIKVIGLLGGLGSRSRKGWGSLTLTKLEGADWDCPATADTWVTAMNSLVTGSAAPSLPYTAFSNGARWNCGPIKNNADAAQQWLAQKYQERVKSTDPKAVRAQFGLPREFKKGTAPRRERRASPLLLHIHQCPNGQALPAAIWLPAAFLPNEAMPGGGDSALQFVESLSSTQSPA